MSSWPFQHWPHLTLTLSLWRFLLSSHLQGTDQASQSTRCFRSQSSQNPKAQPECWAWPKLRQYLKDRTTSPSDNNLRDLKYPRILGSPRWTHWSFSPNLQDPTADSKLEHTLFLQYSLTLVTKPQYQTQSSAQTNLAKTPKLQKEQN